VLLVPMPAAMVEKLLGDSEYREAMGAEDWARAAGAAQRVIGPTLPVQPYDGDAIHWGSYFTLNPETRDVLGTCAFKGAPSEAGAVEIAYFTYPEFEGQGYATVMARRLIELARGVTEVRRVIAHTLPQPNASTRVLTKAGMRFVGEVMDPEDGRVWQWDIPTGR
jgi:ribosomal-protein-alanine N-acetyltransferase